MEDYENKIISKINDPKPICHAHILSSLAINKPIRNQKKIERIAKKIIFKKNQNARIEQIFKLRPNIAEFMQKYENIEIIETISTGYDEKTDLIGITTIEYI